MRWQFAAEIINNRNWSRIPSSANFAGTRAGVGVKNFQKNRTGAGGCFLTKLKSVLVFTAHLTSRLIICENPLNFLNLVIRTV